MREVFAIRALARSAHRHERGGLSPELACRRRAAAINERGIFLRERRKTDGSDRIIS